MKFPSYISAGSGPTGGATSWAQAAGKGLTSNNPGSSPSGASNRPSSPVGSANGQNGGNGSNGGSGSGASSAANNGAQPQSGETQLQKRELEKIREALYATDGWGGVSFIKMIFSWTHERFSH